MAEVEHSWNQPLECQCSLQLQADKLKRLSREFHSWSQRKIEGVKQQLQYAKEILHRLEIAQDTRPLTYQEDWLRRQLKRDALGLALLERTMTRMRSRLNWLKDGDTNTSYFQHHARYRKRKNFMAKIKDNDRIITDQEEKKEVVWNFYNGLLGTSGHHDITPDLQHFHPPGVDLSGLEQIITEEEVWATIKAMPSDKAPGHMATRAVSTRWHG